MSVNAAEMEDTFGTKPQGGLARLEISPSTAVQTALVAQCMPSVQRRHGIGAWIADHRSKTMEAPKLLELALDG